MPKQLSQALKEEKNQLGSVNPWLITLDITLPDTTTLHIVRNNENIVFNSTTYTAANFELDTVDEDAKGTIPSVSIKISDMLQSLEPYMQSQNGCTGSKVIIRVINANYLSENYADLEMAFEVITSKSKAGYVSFSLGIPSPLRKRIPQYKTRGNFCNWVKGYKIWPECGYSGDLPTCKGTLEDCRLHNNSVRFGGQPGLNGKGLRIA